MKDGTFELVSPTMNCWYQVIVEAHNCRLEGICISIDDDYCNEIIELRLTCDGQVYVSDGVAISTDFNYIGTLTQCLPFSSKTLLHAIPKDINVIDALRLIKIITHDTATVDAVKLSLDIRKVTLNGSGKLKASALYVMVPMSILSLL